MASGRCRTYLRCPINAEWLPRQGTLRCSSSSQTFAATSLGARQSLRGERDPPDPTFGPLGNAERLNWLKLSRIGARLRPGATGAGRGDQLDLISIARKL